MSSVYVIQTLGTTCLFEAGKGDFSVVNEVKGIFDISVYGTGRI